MFDDAVVLQPKLDFRETELSLAIACLIRTDGRLWVLLRKLDRPFVYRLLPRLSLVLNSLSPISRLSLSTARVVLK